MTEIEIAHSVVRVRRIMTRSHAILQQFIGGLVVVRADEFIDPLEDVIADPGLRYRCRVCGLCCSHSGQKNSSLESCGHHHPCCKNEGISHGTQERATLHLGNGGAVRRKATVNVITEDTEL